MAEKNNYNGFSHFTQQFGNLKSTKIFNGDSVNYDEIVEAGIYEIVESANGATTSILIVRSREEITGEFIGQTLISGAKISFRERTFGSNWTNWAETIIGSSAGDGDNVSDRVEQIEQYIITLNNDISENSNRIDELDGSIGDIDTALDEIIKIQNSLIGGDSV